MKTVEEVAVELSDANVFSVLNATSGFWHIKLDEKSSELLTFNTPFGRYQYLRMPFGINSAPEIFQKRMTQAFEDLSGVRTIADDILVWGRSEAEHNHRLEQVLNGQGKLDWSSTEVKWRLWLLKFHTLDMRWHQTDWNQILERWMQWKECHHQ